mmetsp:Transcript_10200/g.28451  ORF Transcript_10200/g.28451 Transcript_10200/m.28451 type:complete len:117 (-) Transcript_10200:535-885(-)
MRRHRVMAVHDSDIKSYTVTPEGFDLPRALRLLLLGNGAFEDVACGAQLEEAFREVKRLDEEKKQQKTKSRVAKALVLAPPSSSGSSSRGSVSTGSNPGIIGYFGIAWGGYKTRTK